jgi:hypothetical protein
MQMTAKHKSTELEAYTTKVHTRTAQPAIRTAAHERQSRAFGVGASVSHVRLQLSGTSHKKIIFRDAFENRLCIELL